MPRYCAECGKPIKSRRSIAKYCSQGCSVAFTRRRRDRGAELYDFIMQGEMVRVSTLLEAYHASDRELRGGRPSYLSLAEASAGMPIVWSKYGDKR